MKKIKLGRSDLEVGEISLGCMRINKLSKKDAAEVIENAMDCGVDLFDHADIYGGGDSEEVFADAIHMNEDVREKMKLQTKCGIRKGMFDFSKKHILESVEGSLRRLKTDYVDSLLLHRPDALDGTGGSCGSLRRVKRQRKSPLFWRKQSEPHANGTLAQVFTG